MIFAGTCNAIWSLFVEEKNNLRLYLTKTLKYFFIRLASSTKFSLL